MKQEQISPCLFCGAQSCKSVFEYMAPPVGEVRYPFSQDAENYRRSLVQCLGCDHFYSIHDFDLRMLYEGDYVSSTYKEGGIEKAFQRIVSLDPARSDNVGRVGRINSYKDKHLKNAGNLPRCLDIGSGLCVFLYRLKGTGWECTALDPDSRAVEHARSLGISTIQGDFMQISSAGLFDLITFNKVLEHIENPIEMLKRSQVFLAPGGSVYVEVPDGQRAFADGPGREEFFVEHHHAFSTASLSLLFERAGFLVTELERLQEPSTKYTLRAFGSRRV